MVPKQENKQAKYNQRRSNEEQTDSNQKEGGDNGGKKGKVVKEHV